MAVLILHKVLRDITLKALPSLNPFKAINYHNTSWKVCVLAD